MQAKHRSARCAARFLGGSVLLLAAGCAGVTPQVYSSSSVAEPSTSAPVPPERWTDWTFADAYEDAASLLRRYNAVTQADGNTSPLINAALIGLTAGTLFKGATGGNTRDIAGAGVLGSALWAYNSAVPSRARRDVYRAGAEALSCVLVSAQPFNVSGAVLGKETDAAGAPTLRGRKLAVEQEAAGLKALLEANDGLRRIASQAAPAQRQCAAAQRARCDVPKEATAEERAALEASCKRRAAKPVCRWVPSNGTVTVDPAPRAVAIITAGETELERASRATRSARAAISEIRLAPSSIRSQKLLIEKRVSEEVDKAQPDPATVLAAVTGMRATAFSISSLDVFKPQGSTGSAEGSAKTRTLSPGGPEDRALLQIERATARLREARVALAELVSDAVGGSSPSLRSQLNKCAVKVAGAELAVTPGDDALTIPASGTQTFTVSGGKGLIVGKVDGLELTGQTAGGVQKFEVGTQGAKPGDVKKVVFSDSKSAAAHEVEITVTQSDAAAQPATAAQPPAGAPVPRANTQPIAPAR